MQERFRELQEALEEMKTMKKREYALTLTVCLLLGLVVGMLISPKKRVSIGNNNGNNNGNQTGLTDDDCCCCEDDCDCDCDCDCE